MLWNPLWLETPQLSLLMIIDIIRFNTLSRIFYCSYLFFILDFKYSWALLWDEVMLHETVSFFLVLLSKFIGKTRVTLGVELSVPHKWSKSLSVIYPISHKLCGFLVWAVRIGTTLLWVHQTLLLLIFGLLFSYCFLIIPSQNWFNQYCAVHSRRPLYRALEFLCISFLIFCPINSSSLISPGSPLSFFNSRRLPGISLFSLPALSLKILSSQ